MSITHPTFLGMELVIQYLNFKYNANICFPITGYGYKYEQPRSTALKKTSSATTIDLIEEPHKKINLPVLSPDPIYLDLKYFDDLHTMKPLLLQIPKTSGDYRKAFITMSGTHAILYVYIREGGKEALLYTDSKDAPLEWVKKISSTLGIKTYFNSGTRQADGFSCLTDCLVFGRDSTGINPETGTYIIPNLLQKLEERAEPASDGVSEIRLPNALLKTTQISHFLMYHMQLSDLRTPIYKDETLYDFRRRYSKNIPLTDGTVKKYSSYLQEKGIKYKKIIAIQFYINEMEKELGVAIEREVKFDFIKQAKLQKTEQDLRVLAKQFLQQLLCERPVPLVPHQEIMHSARSSYDTPLQKSDPEELAREYNIALEELVPVLERIKELVNKRSCEPDELQFRYSLNEGEYLLLQLIKQSGLAATKFVLQNGAHLFSAEFWYKVSTISRLQSDLIVETRSLIYQFYQRNELYYFGHQSNYLVERLLILYPELLNEKERHAFQWVMENKKILLNQLASKLLTYSELLSEENRHEFQWMIDNDKTVLDQLVRRLFSEIWVEERAPGKAALVEADSQIKKDEVQDAQLFELKQINQHLSRIKTLDDLIQVCDTLEPKQREVFITQLSPDYFRSLVRVIDDVPELIKLGATWPPLAIPIHSILAGFNDKEVKLLIYTLKLDNRIYTLRHDWSLFNYFAEMAKFSPERKKAFLDSFELDELALMMSSEPIDIQADFFNQNLETQKMPLVVDELLRYFQKIKNDEDKFIRPPDFRPCVWKDYSKLPDFISRLQSDKQSAFIKIPAILVLIHNQSRDNPLDFFVKQCKINNRATLDEVLELCNAPPLTSLINSMYALEQYSHLCKPEELAALQRSLHIEKEPVVDKPDEHSALLAAPVEHYQSDVAVVRTQWSYGQRHSFLANKAVTREEDKSLSRCCNLL
jgi:hypothetical protein